MSFFYLSPIVGDMPIHILEMIITKRIEYLKAICKNETNIAYNEYVIEGSIYDNVGHFLLCIVSILLENRGMLQFILKTEKELFKRRLNILAANELRCFGKKIIRTLKKQEYIGTFVRPLRILCQHLIIKDLSQHICNPLHNEDCYMHVISVNFTDCLEFVAKRKVELKSGNALIPCSLWKQYLASLFSENLTNKLSNTDLSSLRNDPRILDLLEKLKKENVSFISDKQNSNLLLSKDIDNFTKYFPPCMSNLHYSLRKKHRLSHSQRFYYSLFLKEIGMPIEEAIDFWKTEYEKKPNGSHSCSHNWDKDGKKYMYSIRHLYGLEGARKNYKSVGCHRIQSDTSCSDCGCPFKSFDDDKISQVLRIDRNHSLFSTISELRKNKQFASACILFLKEKHLINLMNCDNISFNFTPVMYYNKALKNKSAA